MSSRRKPRRSTKSRAATAAGVRPDALADVLAFGAHPDDIELSCGGTLLKLKDLGHRTAAADLTRGEKGTRGDAQTRQREAEDAARILGLEFRRNLGLPDTAVHESPEATRLVIELIREVRPSLVIAPYWEDSHPDHEACSRLVRRASFLSGLRKADAAGEPFRPGRIIYAMLRVEFKPSFVVDVTAQFQRAMEAIRAHKSQVLEVQPGPGSDSGSLPPNYLGGKSLRSRHFGSLIGVEWGEPFACVEMLEVQDPVAAFGGFRGVWGGGMTTR